MEIFIFVLFLYVWEFGCCSSSAKPCEQSILKINNFNTLSCVVKSNIPSIQHTVKSTTFVVQGIEFIDNECPTTVPVKIGDKNVTISCKFFAQPRPAISWYQRELQGSDVETYPEDSLGSEYEVNTKSEERDIYKSSVRIHEIQSEKDYKVFKIVLGYQNLFREIRVVGEGKT